MLTGDIINTVLNITAFVFMTAMVWVYVKPNNGDEDAGSEPKAQQRTE